MRIIIFFLLVSVFISCKEKHSNYNQNALFFQELVSEINAYFLNSEMYNIPISQYYTDDFVFHSYVAGNKKGNETHKKEYINSFKQMKTAGFSLNIGHSIYLPGIDEKTFDFDGSVRVYYGATLSLDSVEVDFSGYQTINFLDGKISEVWEWADYGGVNNQLVDFID